jgi:hypothetical protein
MSVPVLRTRPAWASLEKHYHTIRGVHFRQLFAEDSERGEGLAIEAAGIYLEIEGVTEPELEHDSSTNNLIRRYRKLEGTT